MTEPTDAEVNGAIAVWQLKEELANVADLLCKTVDSVNSLTVANRELLNWSNDQAIALAKLSSRVAELEAKQ